MQIVGDFNRCWKIIQEKRDLKYVFIFDNVKYLTKQTLFTHTPKISRQSKYKKSTNINNPYVKVKY